MKAATFNSTFSPGAKLAGSLLTLASTFLAANNVEAHVTYSGRDFGSHSGLTNGAISITNQTVTGNYGWADAADGILGDAHRGRAFRFHLDNAALVHLTVTANPKATTNSLGGFTPAFSVYSGLAAVAPFPPSQTTNPPSADHDGTLASLAWRTWWVRQNIDSSATDESPTDGCWNALGDWRIGGDGDLAGDFSQLSSLRYKGSAASTNSGGSVSRSFATIGRSHFGVQRVLATCSKPRTHSSPPIGDPRLLHCAVTTLFSRSPPRTRRRETAFTGFGNSTTCPDG